MSKPYIHALSSAKRYGGKPEDYEPIHNFMDSSKSCFPDNRHRALTHNAWFIGQVLERVKFDNSGPVTSDNRFPYIINSDDKKVFVRDIGEQHILEDYAGKFIPSASDFIQEMTFLDWMQNGRGVPASHVKIKERRDKKRKESEPEQQSITLEIEGLPKSVPFDIGEPEDDRDNVVIDGSRQHIPHLRNEELKD